MAENVVLNNLANLQNDTTTINTINGNNATITAAFSDVLSRTGISPNTMGAPLDMNSWPIMNLPAPGSANSPARLVDVTGSNPIAISLSLTGDVTAPASSGVLTTTIASGAVTSSKIANNSIGGSQIVQGTALSVIGNPGNVTANNTFITGSTRQVLGVNPAGTALAFAQPQGDQLKGTITNDNATAGNVGEYISSTIAIGSTVSLTTATPANITSISLTAGDWDVWINGYTVPANTTNITVAAVSVSTTSATINTTPGNTGIWASAGEVVGGAGLNIGFSVNTGPVRLSLPTTTTVFFVGQANFTVSTCTMYGTIQARRVR